MIPRRPLRTLLTATAIVAATAGVTCAGAVAFGQRFDPRRPAQVVVGPRAGGSPADRVDWGRSGFARTALPTRALVVQWRRSVGGTLVGPAVVDDDGVAYVVAGRGEVIAIGADGGEKSRTLTGVPAPSAPALLVDGTVLLASGAGEAIGVRAGAIRFRTRFGREPSASEPPAPLALDDGGAVVAHEKELVLLDAEGVVRARASLRERVAAPLLSALGRVVAITASGAAYAWTPGQEPVLAGTFESPIDGAAAMADDRTLLAVTSGGSHVDVVDLGRGVHVTRATAVSGVYLGPAAMRGGIAYLLAANDQNGFAVAVDPRGQEVGRVVLAPTPTTTLPDGGTGPELAAPHAGPLVDAAGTLAFVAPDGQVGVVAPDGAVEMIGDTLCPPAPTVTNEGQATPPVRPATLAPAQAGTFLVTCPTGVVARVGSGRTR